ncbi:MAG: glutathione S-transferase N-terminal domain-containing protein [Xanthobacteraceae bacterium]|nr:glutathione S-transferase N-terminal domain-containing protein [Xanthobacteraceae bacterium]
MKVYGHPWSINTRKVLATLAEKGQEAELILVDLPRGGQHAPEHIARHPFAKAPVIEDDGLMIYESAAIMRYIDGKYNSTALVPAKRRNEALMDQWISIGQTYFGEPAHALAIEAIFKRVRKLGEPDPGRIKDLQSVLKKPLDVMDGWLGWRPYLSGDDFSLADLTFMPYFEYMSRLAAACDLIASRQNVANWWQTVSKRSSWEKVGRTGEQPPIGADMLAA